MADLVLPERVSSVAIDSTGAELVDTYLRSLQSAKSRTTMEEGLRRVTRAVSGSNDARAFPWHLLTYEQMIGIRARLVAAGYPPSTVNLSLSGLRQMLKIARVLGKTTSEQRAALDLVKNVTGKRVTKGRAFGEAEFLAMWTACDALEPLETLQCRAILGTLLGAGARREEVCELPARAHREGCLFIIGKGNKERKVPIDAWVAEHLDEWIETRKTLDPTHNLMFCTIGRKNDVVKPWALWFKVRGLASRAGIVDEKGRCTLAPHDFRRTFASRLLDQGFDLSEVQRLMGHASMATTQKYDKRAEIGLAEKRRKVRIFDVP